MNQKVLNKLNPGEKVVQIEEFDNGKYYKVTIHSCTGKFLWLHRITAKHIPFYFATKELAIEFLKYYDNLEWVFADANENKIWLEALQLELLNYTNRHNYYMVDVSGKHLLYLGIWSGLVNTDGRWGIEAKNNILFKDMFKMEDEIKEHVEGTPNNEYLFKMIK